MLFFDEFHDFTAWHFKGEIIFCALDGAPGPASPTILDSRHPLASAVRARRSKSFEFQRPLNLKRLSDH